MLKVVHKKLDEKEEIKQLWKTIEKKFWDRKSIEEIKDFISEQKSKSNGNNLRNRV